MKKLLIFALLLATLLGLTSCGSMIMAYDATGYTPGAKTFEEPITAIEIEWPMGSVSICAHDGEDVIIEESGSNVKSTPLYHRVIAGRLSIKYTKPGINFTSLSGKSLTVKLPRGVDISYLEIDSASAEVYISDIDASSADIESASGEVRITECSISGDLELDAASGNVTITDTSVLGSLEIDTASGNVAASLAGECMRASVDTASGNVKIDCIDISAIEVDTASGDVKLNLGATPMYMQTDTASGDITVTLPSDAAFSFITKSASGDVHCDFEVTKSGNRYTVNGGATGYTFESASGDVYIKKGK